MDGQQYLNQISQSNRPAAGGGGKLANILHSKFFIVGAIGVGLLIVILIIGAMLGGGEDKSPKSLSYALYLHLDNDAAVIKDYQSSLKSSKLRSSSASLESVFSGTKSQLEEYMKAKYNFKAKDISKGMTQEATLAKDALANSLFEAKINGILDRTYAHKMAYEISLVMAEEATLANSAKDATLQELLETSYGSLTNLYDEFENFSETKN